MANNGEKIRKIYNPDDLRSKRQFIFAGKEIHNFYGLPGVFLHCGANEIPTDLNQHARSDGIIYVNIDGEIWNFCYLQENNRTF